MAYYRYLQRGGRLGAESVIGTSSEAIDGRHVGEAADRIDTAHHFEVAPKLAAVFEDTRNGPHEVGLPFPICFINANFKDEADGVTYYGIHLYEAWRDGTHGGYVHLNWDDDGLPLPCNPFGPDSPSRPTTFMEAVYESTDQSEGGQVHIGHTKATLESVGEELAFTMADKGTGNVTKRDFLRSQNFLSRVTLNFLDFIADPRVRVSQVTRSPNNLKRQAAAGWAPKPGKEHRIILSGELLSYVGSHVRGAGGPTKAHYVRAHWRVLRNEERFGARVGTKIWVQSHIRGVGVPELREYLVEGELVA